MPITKDEIKADLLTLFTQSYPVEYAAETMAAMIASWIERACQEAEPEPEPQPEPEPTPDPTPPEPDVYDPNPVEQLGVGLGSLVYATDGLSLGVGVNPGNPATYADDIAAAGFKWVRTRIYWSIVEESEGVYDWTNAPNYDRLVNEFEARGIGVLFMLQLTHNVDIYGEGSAPPYDAAGREAFANYAAEAAARYAGRKVMFELGNEPNIKNFWPTDPDDDGTSIEDVRRAADEYSALADVVIPAMRAANPDVFIVGPGIAGKGGPYTGGLVGAHEYVKRLISNGTVARLDRLSVHFYTAESEYPTDTMDAGKAPEEADYQIYHGLLGDGSPIINTEHGWRTDESESQNLLQASYNVRDFLVGLVNGIRMRFTYLWARTNGQDMFFVADRPAATASGVLASELDGFRFAGRYNTGNPDQYVLEFRSDAGEKRLAAWKRDAGTDGSVTYAYDGIATITDVLGGTASLASSGGLLSAELDVHPVYVRLPATLV